METTARGVIAEAIYKAASRRGLSFAWELREGIAHEVISALTSAPEPVRQELAALLNPESEEQGTPLGRLKVIADFAIANGLCTGTEGPPPETFVLERLAALLNPWRPIETAPKDGWFLAWDRKAKEWDKVHASAVQHVSGKPWKYWLPLPAPPSEDKA